MLIQILGERAAPGSAALEDIHLLEYAEHIPYRDDIFEPYALF
ncbi:hypothetical protein [Streptomyces rimosus]